jgi:hypothetical protein
LGGLFIIPLFYILIQTIVDKKWNPAAEEKVRKRFRR